MSILDRIRQQVGSHAVVLYMKGTPDFPQCGYSARVVDVLQHYGVEFLGVNVLADPEIRQGVKEYANWPTLPQLYIGGDFVGGCDIVCELHEQGELQAMFDKVSA